MKFNSIVLMSLATIALVACGEADDKAKNDPGKPSVPEKSSECVAAGDKCKLENGKWVIHSEDKKDKNDATPAADGSFDYSDIGVTDELIPEKRGFGFWHKGEESPLNAKRFAKNKPTQSPIIQWSSKLNYDKDLWNFVAITVDNGDNSTKNQVKFMFDKIGEMNQKSNKNIDFFGNKAHQAVAATAVAAIGSTSWDETNKKFEWNTIPALVNTLMHRNNKGGWTIYHSDPNKKVFYNQEEDNTNPLDKMGTAKVPLRVYGVNAFLTDTKTDLIMHNRENPDPAKNPLTTMYNRKDKTYLDHANFVWYKKSNVNERVGKATIVETGGTKSIKSASAIYKKDLNNYPTDVELDTLKYTQFGRLTGEGIDPEAEKIAEYNNELIKPYEFSQNVSAAGGGKAAEDWYFARGSEPTPQATLDGLKAAGKEIAYDGQAVMFGIDYDPRQAVKPTGAKGEQSTNAVKPIDGVSKARTLLDGKQNFVRLTWNPSTGDVYGSVYGVWTDVTYLKANTKVGSVNKGNAFVLKVDTNTNKIVHDDSAEIPLGSTADNTSMTKVGSLLTKDALKIQPLFNLLVRLNGKVVEGTNSFGGEAIRCKDGDKGLFQGAFFGKNAAEVGGVINSQTGDFKDENLADPSSKWGGAFGAKNHAGENPEDLVFDESEFDYGTSTEFFNTNP